MKKFTLIPLLALVAVVACKNSDETYDPHHDWQARNAQWFAEQYETAQTAINAAKAANPDGWEKDCDWRIYKTLLKSPEANVSTANSVVCKINKRGDGTFQPAANDSVRLYYRGWIMDTGYPESKDNQTVFSQTFYGDFSTETAQPVAMSVASTVEGFQTVLQYMVDGDDWDVYIPQEMGYAEKESSAIPAYSTLRYRIIIDRMHRSGEKW